MKVEQIKTAVTALEWIGGTCLIGALLLRNQYGLGSGVLGVQLRSP